MGVLAGRIAGHALTIAVVAAVGTGAMVIWTDPFRQGATLSGLNPRGGGPGFLLLLPAAGAGVLAGATLSRGASFVRHLLEGAAVGGAMALATAAGGAMVLPADFPSIDPLLISVGVAYFVARATVAALGALPGTEPGPAAGAAGR